MINVGDRLPEAILFEIAESGLEQKSASKVFSGRKVALFAVPGAFTPTCHNNHLPGFLTNADALKDKGIDAIVCISVNDPFVMNAWADASDAVGKIEFLSDGNAEFTKAIGLDFNGMARGFGIRSKRYSMLVDDGVVKAINIEEAPGKAEASSAETLLGQI